MYLLYIVKLRDYCDVYIRNELLLFLSYHPNLFNILSESGFIDDSRFGPSPMLRVSESVRLCVYRTSLSYEATMVFICEMSSLSS